MIGAYKIEPSTIKDVLRLVSHVELKTHVMPEPYEVKLVSRAELPRVNVLLNKVIDFIARNTILRYFQLKSLEAPFKSPNKRNSKYSYKKEIDFGSPK